MLYAKIDTATIGANTIIPGVPGRNIRVVSYLLMAAGAVNVTWVSGSSGNLSGALPMATGTVIPMTPGSPIGGTQTGVMETLTAGDALILNLSAGAQISGHLTYVLCQ